MALLTGTKPSSWNSVLTGLTKRIYDNKVSNNVYSGDSKISIKIEDTTYTETDDQRESRVLANKLEAYAVALSIVNEIQANATVTTSVTVTSVSGVTTGPSVSGPGTGSGTGSIV